MAFHIVSLSSKIPDGKYHVTKLSSHSPAILHLEALHSLAWLTVSMIFIYKPNKKVTDVSVDMEELKLRASLAGTYHCTCCGKDGRSLTQQSIEIPFDLPMPLLGTDTK